MRTTAFRWLVGLVAAGIVGWLVVLALEAVVRRPLEALLKALWLYLAPAGVLEWTTAVLSLAGLVLTTIITTTIAWLVWRALDAALDALKRLLPGRKAPGLAAPFQTNKRAEEVHVRRDLGIQRFNQKTYTTVIVQSGQSQRVTIVINGRPKENGGPAGP